MKNFEFSQFFNSVEFRVEIGFCSHSGNDNCSDQSKQKMIYLKQKSVKFSLNYCILVPRLRFTVFATPATLTLLPLMI